MKWPVTPRRTAAWTPSTPASARSSAPFGISYEKTSQATLSPTDAELANGANWCLVHSGESSEGDRSYIAHKAIPIARILSRG